MGNKKWRNRTAGMKSIPSIEAKKIGPPELEHYTVMPGDIEEMIREKGALDEMGQAIDTAVKQLLAHHYTPEGRMMEELMAELDSAEKEEE